MHWDSTSAGSRVKLKRVAYDVGLTIRDLRAAPVTKHVIGGLEAALRLGLWAEPGLRMNVI